jgi:7,8-dihydropterin-6-yl-methyl-4-(beta-D-ribofuranosyl)aminobenzene 5'-phosphate synthase
MKITTLVENTSTNDDLISEHGLSLYVESTHHKILFDLGKTDAFYHNAKRLGIDLARVEIVILSHAHYDHVGGLDKFLEINNHAKIYVQKEALKNYYSLSRNGTKKYIGISDSLKKNERFALIDDDYKIAEGIEVISKIRGKELLPRSNQHLFMQDENELIPDKFLHEQNLLITEGG